MIRFDTRDKKPKLYDVLILTLVFAVLIAGARIFGGEDKALLTSTLVALYFLGVLAMLLIAFVKQLQYNPYSYNSIFYVGFALFSLMLLCVFIALSIRIMRRPELYDGGVVISYLMGSAKTFMYLTFPFALLFSIALFVSNVSLLRHERKRLANVLGIILSFLIIAGTLVLFFFDRYATGSVFEVMLHDLVTNLYAAIYVYLECMLIGAIVASLIVTRYEPAYDRDVIIILGCRMRKDGTPTPLLRGRCDRAIEYYQKQKEATGRELIFMPSGGQGSDEALAESTCMKNYLLSQGIPAQQIVEEDKSQNTFENMQFSKEKIMEIKPDAREAFATTNYHVFRSGLYARRHKLRAQGIGAKTKWWFWPNAWVREFVGLLSAHRGKQALILGGMIVLYIVLTVLVYR